MLVDTLSMEETDILDLTYNEKGSTHCYVIYIPNNTKAKAIFGSKRNAEAFIRGYVSSFSALYDGRLCEDMFMVIEANSPVDSKKPDTALQLAYITPGALNQDFYFNYSFMYKNETYNTVSIGNKLKDIPQKHRDLIIADIEKRMFE